MESNFNIIVFWDGMPYPLLVTTVAELSACIFVVE